MATKPSHWLHGRCWVRRAAAVAFRARLGGSTQPASARATRERISSCSRPKAEPSEGASKGEASTSMQPHTVESMAYGPPRGAVREAPTEEEEEAAVVEVAAAAAAAVARRGVPWSSAEQASRRGATEQKLRRSAFCSCEAGTRTCVTSEVCGGSSAAPLSVCC